MHPRHDQAGNVRHIGGKIRADLVGDLREPLEIEMMHVRRRAGPDQLRLMLARQAFHFIHVDITVRADMIRHAVIKNPRRGNFPAMREMPAVRQIQSHHRIARRAGRKIHREIRGRAGIRLDVRMGDAEKFLRTFLRDRLDLIYIFVPAVIAPARIALGIFIREDRTHRHHHLRRGIILGRDHLEPLLLPHRLLFYEIANLFVHWFIWLSMGLYRHSKPLKREAQQTPRRLKNARKSCILDEHQSSGIRRLMMRFLLWCL